MVAAAAFLLTLQTYFVPLFPIGYEGTLTLGGVSFTFGLVLSLIALVLAIIALFRYVRARSRSSWISLDL